MSARSRRQLRLLNNRIITSHADKKEFAVRVHVDTYLLEGDQDLLFPYQQSVNNAKKLLPRLKNVTIYPNVGHGIETYQKAIVHIYNAIQSLLKV